MFVLSPSCKSAAHGRDHQNPGEFPYNPTDDYDGDGLTEQSGDCDDLNPEIQARAPGTPTATAMVSGDDQLTGDLLQRGVSSRR